MFRSVRTVRRARAALAASLLILAQAGHGALAAASSKPAPAKPAPGKAAARGATHPSLAGVWVIQEDYQLGKPLKPAPQLTPAAVALAERQHAAVAAGYVRNVGNMLCLPTGGPILYQMRSPFVVMEGLGRVTFIFETEGSNQPRTVYLKEPRHPDDLYPSFNGHSIGRWEGKTLVVDTVGFNGRGVLPAYVPKSEATHLVERFTVSADGQELTDVLTATDPVSLAKPWTFQLKFKRLPDTEERFEVWCEPDLDAFKALDLQKLKDVDPEVARMLDPDERASDPILQFKPGAAQN